MTLFVQLLDVRVAVLREDAVVHVQLLDDVPKASGVRHPLDDTAVFSERNDAKSSQIKTTLSTLCVSSEQSV